MVNAFFADCQVSWYYKNLKWSKPQIINLCVEEVIMGEGEYYTFPVQTSIIRKYLDGDKEEAAKEFQKWHKEYWEQKKREEEEAKRSEEEAIAKSREEDEYKLYLKLKEKN